MNVIIEKSSEFWALMNDSPKTVIMAVLFVAILMFVAKYSFLYGRYFIGEFG